jgi:hypothetical protein
VVSFTILPRTTARTAAGALSLMLSAVALVACGSASASVSKQSGYVGANAQEAAFIQWTRSGNQLVGSFEDTNIDSSDDTQIDTNSSGFTGVVSGSAITLVFTQALGGATNLSGTLSAHQVTLDVPNGDGTLVSDTFSPSTVAAYNTDVAGLQHSADVAKAAAATAANQQEEQQAAQQAAQAAQQAAQQAQQALDSAVDSASNAVSNDETGIQSDVSSLTTDAAGFTTDLQSAATDLASLQTDFNTVKSDASSKNGSACDDAAQVGDDESQIGDDQSQVGDDVSGGTSDLQSAQTDLASLRSDWVALGQARAADPSYEPSGGLPSGADKTAAAAAATKGIATYEADVTQAQQQAQGLVSQGASVVTQANQLCNSG